MTGPALRVGVLGAARIVEGALLQPAGRLHDVEVMAIAARDASRAAAYADAHGIPRAHGGYASLLADPELDAVYIALPAALHAEWTLSAIDAGKHVLCEKPFTSNAADAERVAARARTAPTVVMEAYHSHHHPLQRRLREIVASGELGRIARASASFCVPIPPGRDIRWDLSLGGGGLLDVGYYAVRQLRELFGEPVVVDARAAARDGVDRLLEATLRFGDGVEGRIVSSIWSRRLLHSGLGVDGSGGRLRASSPYHPQQGSRVRVRSASGARVERQDRVSTYDLQLSAFRDAVRSGGPVATGADAALAQLRTIDAIYAAAGMSPRP